MSQHFYVKKDGCKLWLYDKRPRMLEPCTEKGEEAPEASPHLGWHPLQGEWIVYAAHRGNGPSWRSRDTAHCTSVVQGHPHRDSLSRTLDRRSRAGPVVGYDRKG